MKRIIICADGTWNRPEKNEEDVPTNVLKFARGIAPVDSSGVKQVVFYDWGIGSYHNSGSGGAFGKGLEKNVMDGYRFLVHNYESGDEVYLFGFSRGAYTVRSLSGLINNCHILKGAEAWRVEEAFELYKNPDHKPNGPHSVEWKNKHSVPNSGIVNFIGVWDTVGAMGLPFSIFGLIKDKHQFYDNKLGSNVKIARHALSLDEKRDDFEPTIWSPKPGVDLKQVWFSGVHSDIGGGYPKDSDGTTLSDIPLDWLKREAESVGLTFENFLDPTQLNPQATIHNSYKGLMRLLGKYKREIPDPNEVKTIVHPTVKELYDHSGHLSHPIKKYIEEHGEWPEIGE